MKGFIYLLEIAVAAILVAIVLATFFSIRIKENWERPDIIAIGNNIMNNIEQNEGYLFEILNGNLTIIERSRPANVKFGLEISGTPKILSLIGCTEPISCDFVNNILTPSFANGRWKNFTIEYFNISASSIPSIYDAIILVNYTDYSSQKQKIIDYMNRGGAVIGINATYNNNDPDFNDIFNLTPSSSSATTLNFAVYDPYKNKISKYFFGYGFDAATDWYVWGDDWAITYMPSYINLTRVSDKANVSFLREGYNFSLTGPDMNTYHFKVKKIWIGQRVDLQPLNTSFVFKDFSENNCKGNNIVSDSANSIAGMTINNRAVWISDPDFTNDEYRTLVKAAISAATDKWTVKDMEATQDIIKVSSFFSLCCDMPEVSELVLSLSYTL